MITQQKSLETNPLTGETLLQKVKELSHLSRKETAISCGYYTQSKDGKVRVNLNSFYSAILAAKCVTQDKYSHNIYRENSIKAMANDPEIQAEILTINEEFSITEMDGLTDL